MKTVCLLSGGIDSTVALALTRDYQIDCALALTFDYGQQHRREIDAATLIAHHYGVEHQIVDITSALPTPSALTGAGGIPTSHADSVDATFVPGRNLVMLAVGVGVASGLKAGAVVIGANADDRAGYPDCRPRFIQAVAETASQATDGGVTVWAPLLRMNKAEVVATGRRLEVPLDMTWSCYRGGDEPCRNCGACESRIGALA